MRIKNINHILLVAVILFSINFAPLSAEIEKISSSAEQITLRFIPKHNGFIEMETENGSKVYLPNISNSFERPTESETPLELIATTLISIPNPDGFKLSDLRINNINTFTKKIAPKPTITQLNNISYNKYIISVEKYLDYKTPNWVKLEYAGVSRGRHLARLDILAARYNAISNIIEIPDEIIVTITFSITAKNNITAIDNEFPISINHYETRNFALSNTSDNKPLNSNLRNLNDVSNDNWIRLTINEEGIYKVDASQLAARGMNIPTNQINTIKVFGHGGKNLSERVSNALNNDMKEQEIIVNTKPNGELESIIFYAANTRGFNQEFFKTEHYRNDFSFNNYYLITFGGRDGKRAFPQEPPQGEIKLTPNWYYHKIFFNEETTNPYPDGAGRTYLGRSFFGTPFVNMLHNLKRDQQILYRFSLAHRSPEGGSIGTFNIKQSGNHLANVVLHSSSGSYTHAKRMISDITAPASQVAIDGRSVLSLEYSNNSNATPFFDYYEIHYPREFIPVDNEITFYSDTAHFGIVEYRINGFSGSIFGFEITEIDAPKQIKNLSITGGLFRFIKNETRSKSSRYIISSRLRSPAAIESIKLANLRGNDYNADVIIITHSQFKQSAIEFAEYRSQTSGMNVSVVKVEDIYNEFSSTIPDITAIRDYIAYTYHNWSNKPKYVVLWGDAHYDYRNIQLKMTNFIPTYLSNELIGDISETSTVATDDYFVWVDGNDNLMDLAIGRVPIDSRDNGHWFINKLRHYENNSSKDAWRTNILLIADDSYVGPNKSPEGNFHTNQSEELSALLPAEFIQKKVYLSDYPTENIPGGKRKPGVYQEFISTVNTTGTLIFNWIGHGNPRVLAHEEFFERETTIPQLTNLDKLFFVTAATCDFGRFDKDGPRSGAEELVFSRQGGAIGVFTASRVVEAGANHNLNKELYRCLFTRRDDGNFPTTGAAVMRAKQTFHSANSQKFLLIGDPTMRFHFPEHKVVIESVNGIPISDTSTISVKALSNVRIKAKIVNALSNEHYSVFNGLSYITLLDGDERKIVKDDLNTTYNFLVQGGMLNRSTFPVVNGSIEAEFVIPKDISFSDNNSRLFIYASSDDNQFATGTTNMIKVDDIDVTSVNDNNGPIIRVYLDSYSFKSGDVVRRNPLLIVELWDETGINSTGLGIGHRIEARINNNPNPIDLTSRFNTSTADPKAGTIQHFLYGLTPGIHRISIRAWDVFNNPTTEGTYFRIPNEGDERIADAMLIPNPMNDKGRIQFFHNFTPPFTIDLSILNFAGIEVRRIEEVSTSQIDTFVNFDSRDNNGNLLPQGAYYYFVRLISTTNGMITGGGKLGIITR